MHGRCKIVGEEAKLPSMLRRPKNRDVPNEMLPFRNFAMFPRHQFVSSGTNDIKAMKFKRITLIVLKRTKLEKAHLALEQKGAEEGAKYTLPFIKKRQL